MNEARDLYEGIAADLDPSQKAPKPHWCPICGLTIIERFLVRCEDCEDALQSEDK